MLIDRLSTGVISVLVSRCYQSSDFYLSRTVQPWFELYIVEMKGTRYENTFFRRILFFV